MKKHIKIFISVILIFILNYSYSQSLNDFTNINFLELNTSQIDILLKKASDEGYNQLDLIKIAKSKGYSKDQIKELETKFESSEILNRAASNATFPLKNSRLRKQYNEEIKIVRSKKSKVFGYDIFKGNGFLTFQNNYNMPTPDDYILGPGDNLYIDIFGESERYFQGEISPDGTFIVENIGPINLSGLSIKRAKQKLISKLSPLYTGLPRKKTFVNLSLGSPRSISINVIGEVNIPGTYTFSALNTVFNALYVAGGITENATLRDIKVYRNNKLVEEVDLYDYLNSGDASRNLRLKDEDLIIVETYTNRIELKGNVKKPGIYEFSDSETLTDILNYSGGFNDRAYKNSVKLTRISDNKLKIIDVNEDSFDNFKLKAGDIYEASEVLDLYANRIIIQGAVYRPGEYSISENMSVKDLIEKSGGLKPDAYFDEATIIRTKNDYSTEIIPINLTDFLNDKSKFFKLQKEDVLRIYSINNMEETKYIEIIGEVNNPGIYFYSKNIDLKQLILISGGLKSHASTSRVEVSRFSNSNTFNSNKNANIITLDLEKENNFILKPFDKVVIRKNSDYIAQKYVKIQGEVLHPGIYSISSSGERIFDIIERAGGIKESAYLGGASLYRISNDYIKDNSIEKKIKDLQKLKDSYINQLKFLSESDSLLLKKINKNIINLNNLNLKNKEFELFSNYSIISDDTDKNYQYNNNSKMNDKNLVTSSFEESNIFKSAINSRKNQLLEKDSLLTYSSNSKYESIGINFNDISEKSNDLLLEDGDIIVIPKKLETVKSNGELLYPNILKFKSNKSFNYYISLSGGYGNNAKKSKSYVIYPNGNVARTKKFLIFNIYPKIEPGSEIIVPKKIKRSTSDMNSILNYSTTLATLFLVISQIN